MAEGKSQHSQTRNSALISLDVAMRRTKIMKRKTKTHEENSKFY